MSVLQINARQLHLLGQGMLRRFERDCVADLRREHAALTQPHPDEVLLQFVRQGITRAAALDITGVTDVKDWLGLMLRLGPGFDADPQYAALRDILGRTDYPAQLRLADVAARLPRPAPADNQSPSS